MRLPVDRFETHLALFHLLHVGVSLKGEGREVQQTAPTWHEMRMPHFTAGVRTPCISPRRAADGDSSILSRSSTPALGTSSLESPSSSLFSKPPLSLVSANAPGYIQSENVALPNRLQSISYSKGGSSKQKEQGSIVNKSPGGKKHKQVDGRGWCSPSEGEKTSHAQG